MFVYRVTAWFKKDIHMSIPQQINIYEKVVIFRNENSIYQYTNLNINEFMNE